MVIQLNVASCGVEEISNVVEAFDRGWITTTGFHNDAFEDEFCDRLNIARGLACCTSSGTAALHLAYRLLGIERGDIVWCATLTFIATIAPAIQLGAIPVFIDCDETLCIDPDVLAESLAYAARIGSLPKAIVVVHLYGQPVNMVKIMAIADKYEIPVIEDVAEGLGATCNGRDVGTFGAISIFSFNGNKMITTGGGGMLVAKDKAIAKRAKYLAFQARNSDKYSYSHDELGYNYSMSNVLAGIGRAQLKKLDRFVDRKREILWLYATTLRGEGVRVLESPDYGDSCHWLSIVFVPSHIKRLVMDYLWSNGIDCRPLWLPLHLQSCLSDWALGSDHAVEAEATGICLPSGVGLTDGEIGFVCQEFNKILKLVE